MGQMNTRPCTASDQSVFRSMNRLTPSGIRRLVEACPAIGAETDARSAGTPIERQRHGDCPAQAHRTLGTLDEEFERKDGSAKKDNTEAHKEWLTSVPYGSGQWENEPATQGDGHQPSDPALEVSTNSHSASMLSTRALGCDGSLRPMRSPTHRTLKHSVRPGLSTSAGRGARCGAPCTLGTIRPSQKVFAPLAPTPEIPNATPVPFAARRGPSALF